jgi:hypothetical protein
MALTTETQLFQVQEGQGFAINCPSSVISRSLSANTSVNISISNLADASGDLPTYLIFSGNGNFYVRWNASSASIPGNNSDGTAAELNPGVRKITNSITQFSIIAPADMILTILLYRGN